MEPVHRGVGVVLYLLTTLMITAVLWATFSEVDRIVVARGKLVTTTGSVVLQPLETSVIRSIDVREGRMVRQGEVLGTLDPTFATADVNQLEMRLNSLNVQIERLDAELQAKPPRFTAAADALLQEQLYRERQANHAARMAQFAETSKRFGITLQGAEDEMRALQNRIRNLQELLKIYEESYKDTHGSLLKVLESKETLMNLQQQLQQATHRGKEVERNLASVAAEQEAFSREWLQKIAEELVVARRERAVAKDQLDKAQRKQELISLTAPVDAVVLEVAKRSVGSVVREAEPLFTLVPLHTPLEAEVEVDPSDIGLLRVGDPAKIKLDAFPFQKHGTLDATLRTFSQDAFSRSQQVAVVKGESFYMGRLETGPMTLTQVAADTHLLPGMALTAEIKVGRRSVISYFLYPLIRMLDEGLREP
ncbi:MAG: HlyD family type I secretion periplasmic adaptor subunit [Magnetococcales bacterium]|nr:HlyD family type I secretion periplasmic adaptor subunit [Magnetococcales bacterium]